MKEENLKLAYLKAKILDIEACLSSRLEFNINYIIKEILYYKA